MGESGDKKRALAATTRAVHAGYDPQGFHGFVNPPVVRASTVLFPDAESLIAAKARYTYGRHGTPTTEALEAAIADIEGAEGAVLAPSGLAAISLALMSALGSGDHLLVTDSCYYPTRHLCDTVLKRMGVTVTYYDPRIGGGIAALVQPNTRLVFLESPGSLTFEMQDVRGIATVAHERGLRVAMDNTWATPLLFRPLAHGVDLSIGAGTKYLTGHADVMIGTIAAGGVALSRLRETRRALGFSVGPDDAYLALRGLRTLPTRLDRHGASGLTVARWLSGRPEVAQMLHPALPEDPGHPLWKRDFSGACGLFGVALKPFPPAAVRAMLDSLRLFGLGYSWGGFESLAILADPAPARTAVPWSAEGPLLRLHVGLEDPADLIADLEQALAKLGP